MSTKDKVMRVLLVAPYSSKRPGGIGTWSKILIDYCEKRDDVDLFFLNTVQGLPKRQALGNMFTHLVIGALDSFLIIIRVLCNMIKLRPDVVHYTSSAAFALHKDIIVAWIVKKVFKCRFVIHWHFGRIPLIFQDRGKEYRLFSKVCRCADMSITIDNMSFQTLQTAGINSVYIPNPIPIPLQHKSECLDIDKVFNTRIQGTVLFVGHMIPTKGVYELIEACSDCEEVKQLVMIGPLVDESLKLKLEAIANKRDNGKWLQLLGEKQREDVWDYYEKCGVFCLPSYTEGFPNVILEAMAFACPIIATKVGAIPEMLNEGDCGVMLEPREVEQLRKALKEVISNKERTKEMGLKAHNKVISNYIIEKLYNNYYNVWK